MVTLSDKATGRGQPIFRPGRRVVESFTNSPDKILQVRLTNLLLDWDEELRQIRREKDSSAGEVRTNRQGLETMLEVCQEQVREILQSATTPLSAEDMLHLLGEPSPDLLLLYSDVLKEAESSPLAFPPPARGGAE